MLLSFMCEKEALLVYLFVTLVWLVRFHLNHSCIMLTMKRDTVDSFATFGDNWARRSSIQSNPVLVLPHRLGTATCEVNTTPLSPPPIPSIGSPGTKTEKIHVRLRSDSGLSFHTNQSAFRQYTDYNSDGSPRSPSYFNRPLSFDRASSPSVAEAAPTIGSRCSFRQLEPLPDFYSSEAIALAFSDATISQRLCQFAQSRNCAADMEFLMKV